MVLPAAYELALRLRDDGAGDEAIAAALEVPVEAVPALLRLAEAKQAADRK